MQDDFDNGMGLPDEELGGSSTLDTGEHGAGHEHETEPASAPAGRPSGGARARKSSAQKSPAQKSSARKTAAARKTSRPAKKKGGGRKAAKKKGGARKGAKKAGRRKAGSKK